MSRITVTISAEDLAVFASVSKHPFTVVPAETQPQVFKRTMWPPRPSTLKAYRQRIIDFVALHPGATGNQIIKNVSGGRTNIGAQIKALRESGELHVEGNGWVGDTYRYYIADTIEQEAAA